MRSRLLSLAAFGRALAALTAAMAFGAGAARADDAHYQNFVLGERAAGMGGAFTAIADDPSGTYYNPAGLVDAKSGILSGNLNVYGFQQQALSNALHVPASNLFDNLKNSAGAAFQQLNTVPGMGGTVYGLGKKDDSGRYSQALALSVLVPDDTSSSALTYVLNSAGQLQSLSQTTFDQTAIVGLAYSLRIDSAWSIGFSANGTYRNFQRVSRSVEAQGAQPSQSFFEDDVTLKLAVVGLYVQTGVLWTPFPRLSFGATLASPSLTIFSSASTDEIQTGGASGLTETYQPNLTGDSRLPVHGRLGVAYRVIPDLLVSADLSLWGTVRYSLVDGANAQGRLPNFVNDIQRNGVANLNFGGQYTLARKYLVRAGFFTNFSSAPGIDSGTEPQLDNVNLYGVTVGLTLPSEHTETTFGTMVSFGDGQSKTPTANQAQQALIYATGPTNQLFLDIFLGGSYQF